MNEEIFIPIILFLAPVLDIWLFINFALKKKVDAF